MNQEELAHYEGLKEEFFLAMEYGDFVAASELADELSYLEDLHKATTEEP